MKKFQSALLGVLMTLLGALILFTLLFYGCKRGTKLSKLTGVNADGIAGIRFHNFAQSFAPSVKENCYARFLFFVDVEYEEADSFVCGVDCVCYDVTLKDKKMIFMYYSRDKKMYADYYDGENRYYYVSCGKVYIPRFAVEPK